MRYDDPEVEGDQAVALHGDPRLLDGAGRRAPQATRRTTSSPSWSPPTSRRATGLTDDEFGFFVILLAVAGNETTRNAITHGMHAFFQNPDQWELYKRERPETAADEIIRWATPVTVFQRTALNDVELGGVADQEGRAGRPLLRQRQLRRGRLRRPVPLRHHPRPQPAPGLRRPRRPLLHRRQPGPPGGQPDLQRARRPRAGHQPARGAAAAAPRLDQRHQGPAGRLPLTLDRRSTE